MIIRVPLATFIASALLVASASAQPQITLSTIVVGPGESVTVSVTGGPGVLRRPREKCHRRLQQAGVALGVGNDVVILAQGVFSGSGERSIDVVPPFNGTIL